MSKKQDKITNGIGFIIFLTIIFIGLKLSGTISWSWTWVLSPIWGSVVLSIASAVGLIIYWINRR